MQLLILLGMRIYNEQKHTTHCNSLRYHTYEIYKVINRNCVKITPIFYPTRLNSKEFSTNLKSQTDT